MTTTEKTERYEELLLQLKGLTEGGGYWTGMLANVSAAIHDMMGFLWVGFYLVCDGKLRLGPFKGPVACYSIDYGRGVCGTAWQQRRTIVVDDVELFHGHIACSSLSRSEIVVPLTARLRFDGTAIMGADTPDVVGVLDIDSATTATFDSTDKAYLERACRIIAEAMEPRP